MTIARRPMPTGYGWMSLASREGHEAVARGLLGRVELRFRAGLTEGSRQGKVVPFDEEAWGRVAERAALLLLEYVDEEAT